MGWWSVRWGIMEQRSCALHWWVSSEREKNASLTSTNSLFQTGSHPFPGLTKGNNEIQRTKDASRWKERNKNAELMSSPTAM